jgi:hypothetical protein
MVSDKYRLFRKKAVCEFEAESIRTKLPAKDKELMKSVLIAALDLVRIYDKVDIKNIKNKNMKLLL